MWAIAAVHGEATRLARVHAAVEPRFEAGDRLVYLGNYLGHGSDVCATVDEVLRFRRAVLALPGMMACDVALLRGAQEEMWSKLLQIHLAMNPAEVLEWMLGRGLEATLRAYGGDARSGLARARTGAVDLARWTGEMRAAMQAHPGHYTLMSALRRAAFTEDGALLFVHAGLDAGRPLDVQGDALWWGGARFESLAEPYAGFRLVVRGFDPEHRGVRVAEHSASIDSGCGFGGPLTAACFDATGALVDHVEG